MSQPPPSSSSSALAPPPAAGGPVGKPRESLEADGQRAALFLLFFRTRRASLQHRYETTTCSQRCRNTPCNDCTTAFQGVRESLVQMLKKDGISLEKFVEAGFFLEFDRVKPNNDLKATLYRRCCAKHRRRRIREFAIATCCKAHKVEAYRLILDTLKEAYIRWFTARANVQGTEGEDVRADGGTESEYGSSMADTDELQPLESLDAFIDPTTGAPITPISHQSALSQAHPLKGRSDPPGSCSQANGAPQPHPHAPPHAACPEGACRHSCQDPTEDPSQLPPSSEDTGDTGGGGDGEGQPLVQGPGSGGGGGGGGSKKKGKGKGKGKKRKRMGGPRKKEG